MRQVLLTGAGGFIGKHLADALGHHDDITLHPFGRVTGQDILEATQVEAGLKGMDVVIHCAGYAHAHAGGEAGLYTRLNRDVVVELLDSMARQQVPCLIFFSSVKAANSQESPYAQSKFEAEQAIQQAVREGKIRKAIILRPAMVYGTGSRGNLERMIGLTRRGLFPSLPETANRRSMIYIKDVVSAVETALVQGERQQSGCETWLLAHPQQLSGAQIYRDIRQALGLAGPKWTVPYPVLCWLAWSGSWLQGRLKRTLPFNREVLEKLLGDEFYQPEQGVAYPPAWAPAYPLSRGLGDMLDQSSASPSSPARPARD